MENKKIYGFVGAIILLIILFIYYKIYHSCKKNEWFNLDNFSCKECKSCLRGNFAVKNSCTGYSNTICKKWKWCNKNQKILKYGSATNDFVCEDLGKCANINCKDGLEYIVGWQTCQNLGNYDSQCELCSECAEDEVDVIHCKNRRAHQVNYNIEDTGNGTTKPLSCSGIYDRVCEPKNAVRLNNTVNIFFNNNQCLSRISSEYDYIKNSESDSYSSLCSQYLDELSLQLYSENLSNLWNIIDADNNLDQNCSLTNNDTIKIFYELEDFSIIYLASCFDPIDKKITIGTINTKSDLDLDSVTGNASEFISDRFKIVDSGYNNNLINSRTNNDGKFFRLMIVNSDGINFRLDNKNKICKTIDKNCKEYNFYLGFKELNSGLIPFAYNEKTNHADFTKIQFKIN